MKKVLFFVLLAFASAAPAKNVLQPSTSVKCTAPGETVSSFNVDLYPTGHPMGGVTMFQGMFEADTEGVDCGNLYGNIITEVPQHDHLIFHATSNCLRKVEFFLEMPTDFIQAETVYASDLKYRSYDPFGPGPFQSQKINCELVTDK